MENIWTIISTSAFIGAIASVLTSFLTLKYTRRNLKTTKYIETIITERIKWINLLRNDFSILITSILVLQDNKEKLHETEFESQRLEYVNHLTMRDTYEDDELEDNYNSKRLINDINLAIEKCLTPAEIVIKATQVRLRLDLKEYKEMSDMLGEIISEYSIIDLKSKNSNVDINKLSMLTQEMLTVEWKRVIDEVETK